jgi:hypothetical protein
MKKKPRERERNILVPKSGDMRFVHSPGHVPALSFRTNEMGVNANKPFVVTSPLISAEAPRSNRKEAMLA